MVHRVPQKNQRRKPETEQQKSTGQTGDNAFPDGDLSAGEIKDQADQSRDPAVYMREAVLDPVKTAWKEFLQYLQKRKQSFRFGKILPEGSHVIFQHEESRQKQKSGETGCDPDTDSELKCLLKKISEGILFYQYPGKKIQGTKSSRHPCYIKLTEKGKRKQQYQKDHPFFIGGKQAVDRFA